MNAKSIIIGALALVSGGFFPSCKKQDAINILNQGSFSDTTSSLKTATSLPIGVAVDYTPLPSRLATR
jgi:hypothetical protein